MPEQLGPYWLGPDAADGSEGIYTGDARTMLANLPRESIDIIVTDPPWGVSYKKPGQPYMVGDTVNLLPYIMPEFHRILKPTGAVYLFTAVTRLVEMLPLFQTYFKLHSLIVWDKQVGMIPHHLTHYKLRWVPILYGSRGLHRLHVYRDDVISVPGVRGKRRIHSTQKPVKVIRYLLEASASEGVIILDPFMGSGTTAEAAYESGCLWLGFEIESVMAELARERVRGMQRMMLLPEPEQAGMDFSG